MYDEFSFEGLVIYSEENIFYTWWYLIVQFYNVTKDEFFLSMHYANLWNAAINKIAKWIKNGEKNYANPSLFFKQWIPV